MTNSTQKHQVRKRIVKDVSINVVDTNPSNTSSAIRTYFRYSELFHNILSPGSRIIFESVFILILFILFFVSGVMLSVGYVHYFPVRMIVFGPVNQSSIFVSLMPVIYATLIGAIFFTSIRYFVSAIYTIHGYMIRLKRTKVK